MIFCLVGGGYSTGNIGLYAMTYGNIRSILHSCSVNEIYNVDYGVGPEVGSIGIEIDGKEYTIDRLLFRFSKNLSLPNNIFRLLILTLVSRAIPLQVVKKALLRSSKSLDKMASANLICSIAGGDSFSDIYGFRQLLYVSMPMLLGLALDKPVVLLPQTYGPFSGIFSRILAKFIMRKARLMYSRDHDGLQVIQQLIGSPCGRAHFAYDMGFALNPIPPEPNLLNQIDEIKRGGPVVGLNVSGLLCKSEYRRKNMFGLKVDYIHLVNSILQNLIEKQRHQVILIPHVLGGGGPEEESDDSACERIFTGARERFGDRIHYFPAPFTPHTMKYLIGQCDFFLGSRMHACIGALSQCVPTIGLAYSHKFVGVLNSIGVGDIVVDLRSTDETGVLVKLDALFAQREAIRQELHGRMLPIHDSVLNFYSREEFRRLCS